MITRVSELTSLRPIVESNGASSQEMRSWAQLITDRALIVGTGSPEGVVDAPQASMYMDEMALSGNILYVKRDNDVFGDDTLGWILV